MYRILKYNYCYHASWSAVILMICMFSFGDLQLITCYVLVRVLNSWFILNYYRSGWGGCLDNCFVITAIFEHALDKYILN